MNPQEAYWAGIKGDLYLIRNRVDWRARIPFWRQIMDRTGARSVYEVGCNAGWNLSAIREVAAHTELYGCEINEQAYWLTQYAGLPHVQNGAASECLSAYPGGGMELVFTAGVLIHVAPDNLREMMQGIVDASSHYILAIEYASEVEEMIEYRGELDKLWKRPFGRLYEELGLSVVQTGDAEGFDRCSYWLLEK